MGKSTFIMHASYCGWDKYILYTTTNKYVNSKQDKNVELLAMNDLKIFTSEGNIPYINNVSIDKNKGWPNIRNNTSSIKEKTKTMWSSQ